MDLNNIKVSVITPTFNDEKYVLQALYSALNQTHTNLEIIIVDDCSTDNTVQIIGTIKDARIKLLKNDKNYGAAFSRNKAISLASGEYIAFLDGDDFWDITKIEKQLSFMVVNNYCFSCTEYYIVDENGKNAKKYVTGPKKITHRLLLKNSYVGCLTAMYKKDIYPDLQIPNDIYKRNDYALWLKLSEKTDCYYLFDKLAYYRKRNGDSVSSIKKVELIRFHKTMFLKLYNISQVKACLLAYRNAFYYVIKRLFFVRGVKHK